MFTFLWPTRLFTVVAATALLLTLPGSARSQEAAPPQQLLGSRVTGLMSFDFANTYITPRGLQVEDQGVVGQPLLLLFWKLHSSDHGALKEATLSTGVWNSFHSQPAGVNPSRWDEIDPILGLTLKFQHGWVVDAGTTAFYTPTDSYKPSGHADFKLTYNDSHTRGFSLNPYVDVWFELKNKATVVFNPVTSSQGRYVTLGATPTVDLRVGGATLDVLTYVNIVSANFYQRVTGADGGSGLAVTSVAPKVNVPLKFLGIAYGAWTGYLGVAYYHLSNEGLLDGNQVLVNSPERKSNLTRIHGGLSVFF
jgi:hypothetical protein